ncbi:MAG: transporter [Desulfobulbaceae bacterium]|nr:transporter [Desulfobulbaceae bacterium]
MRKTPQFNKKVVLVILLPVLFFALFGFDAGEAVADNDPRDYVPAPVGTNVFTLYYQHRWGDELYAQGEKAASDYRLRTDLSILKWTFFRQISDKTVGAQLALPYAKADLDWNSGGVNQDAEGIGDIVMLAGFWPYENPKQRLWWGVTGWVTMPTGDYDDAKAVNIGNNRWAFKGETNVTYGIQPDLLLEGTASLEMYTDNDSYLVVNTLEQDPVLTLEAHLSKNLSQTTSVSLDYFFHSGGETTLAGTAQDDCKRDHALQTTITFPLVGGWFTRLVYRNDFKVRNGAETQTAGFRLIKPF